VHLFLVRNRIIKVVTMDLSVRLIVVRMEGNKACLRSLSGLPGLLLTLVCISSLQLERACHRVERLGWWRARLSPNACRR